MTRKNGALLIIDEVITGFRLQNGSAQTLLGVEGDLTTMGKIIGGGVPVAAYGGRAELMNNVAPLGPVYQAGTLAGNPLAMRAGIATLEGTEPSRGCMKVSTSMREEAGARIRKMRLRERGLPRR